MTFVCLVFASVDFVFASNIAILSSNQTTMMTTKIMSKSSKRSDRSFVLSLGSLSLSLSLLLISSSSYAVDVAIRKWCFSFQFRRWSIMLCFMFYVRARRFFFAKFNLLHFLSSQFLQPNNHTICRYYFEMNHSFCRYIIYIIACRFPRIQYINKWVTASNVINSKITAAQVSEN